jgi:Type IV secretion-system coupling protein DNA-binding domain
MIPREVADRLAPDKLKRLIEIKRTYPDTPLEKLPGNVMHEVFLILQTAKPLSGKPSMSANDTHSTNIPESEKLLTMEEILNDPICPVPKKDIPHLTKQQKLDMFDKLVSSGAIKYQPPEQRAQPKQTNHSVEDKLKDLASKLPEAKLTRLIEILQTYQDTPPEGLPPAILSELTEIVAIGEESSPPREEAKPKPDFVPPNDSPPSFYKQVARMWSKPETGGFTQFDKGSHQRDEAKSNVTIDYGTLYAVIGTNLKTSKYVPIPLEDRQLGLYIIGTTGTGKSTLLANLILTDIKQGLGVCLIEPHGDLTKKVLSCIPEERLQDVILLDLMDSEYPFGLNIFECRNPKDINEVAKTVTFVFHVFEKMWSRRKKVGLIEVRP